MTTYDTFADGIGITVLESDRGTVDTVQENSPISIHGVAIPENTILEGGQGVPHVYTPAAAEEAAEVLAEQVDDPDATVHIVKNFHDIEGQAGADDIIGEVTAASYSEGVGVLFGAEITDEATAQKIDLGYLDVSPSVARSLGDIDETLDARMVAEVAGFRDIAVVGQGQPGADVNVGSNPAIEALSRAAVGDVLGDGSDGPGDAPDDDPDPPMTVDDAKETIAEEYDLDVAELEDRLETAEDPAPDTDENTIVLVESE